MEKIETDTILFDIDRTLLNTSLFIRNLINFHSETLGITSKIARDQFEDYVNSIESSYYFDYIELAERISESPETLSLLLDRYLNDASLYPKYSDVDTTLISLKQIGFDIGIFSEGVPRFQANKLKNLNLSVFKDNLIFIGQTKRSHEFLSRIPEGAAIVDDNPEVIDVLVKYGRFNPIYINREKSDERPDSAMIESLSELLELIRKP